MLTFLNLVILQKAASRIIGTIATLTWLLFSSGFAVSQSNPKLPSPDYRIIVIDTDLFASIDRKLRNQAIDDMFEDIANFEIQAPASMDTVIFYKESTGLTRFRPPRDASNLAEAFSKHRSIIDMRRGYKNAGLGLSLGDMRSEILKLVRRKAKKAKSVDLHIFANTWYISDAKSKTNFQTYNQPTQCMIKEDNSTKSWPSNKSLTVEFRPPESLEKPSISAQANFIAYLVGTHAPQSHIQTRGVKGPRCAMTTGEVSTSYNPSGATGALECSKGPVRRTQGAGSALACRSPSTAAIAANLIARPVNLIASPTDRTIGSAQLRVVTSPRGQQLTAQIGGVPLGVGRPVQLNTSLPTGRYSGAIAIQSPSNCTNPGTWSVEIDIETKDPITLVVSKPDCTDLRIPLPEVILK